MGLRLFESKPQTGAWSNFLKWQLTFWGEVLGGAGGHGGVWGEKEKHSKNIWFGDQARV